MKKQKSILLPEAFFTATFLLLWILEEYYELDEHATGLCAVLTKMVEEKFEAMNRRKTFSAYKLAPPGSPEREALRCEYLTMTYSPKDWHSNKEIGYDPFYDEDIPF